MAVAPVIDYLYLKGTPFCFLPSTMALATIDLNRPALLEKPVNRRRNLKRKMPTLGASLREANTIIFSDTLDFTSMYAS